MTTSSRALYDSNISDFLNADPNAIFGILCKNYHGDATTNSREAWREEIATLQEVLSDAEIDYAGHIIFEYEIPRLGKRIDVVLLIHGIIFCLEFKCGQKDALQADVEQVLDYALDLKNFHLFSHDRYIAPILVPTRYAKPTANLIISAYNDMILNPLITGSANLRSVIKRVIKEYGSADEPNKLDHNWIISPYSPTPTIIEAARSLYEGHSVEDITRHEADKVNTDATISAILDVIKCCKERNEKSICFVTGVPGAGKTLVGLDVAVRQTYQGHENPVEGEKAVYLSGNGPLVAVLTEALAIDNYNKCRARGEDKKKSASRREVSEFIQIIHRYRDNMLAKIKNPVENEEVEIDPEKAIKMQESGYGEVEHVAIFDEAQRSWTHKRIADYLRRGGTYGNKLKVPNFPMSEAAFLIWSLDQRQDWATIVCLVGGGQEINTGEAGISEWIKALNEKFPHWKIYISNQLTQPEYAEGKINTLLAGNKNVTFVPQLHLGVSLRSFRAEKLSAFVHSLLTFNPDASSIYTQIKDKYPIVLTRSMDTARQWLRQQTRGTQRSGILVTKVAARFKPLAVHILPQDDNNAVHWFLEDKTDVRSSNFLEDAATEIQVQGLELDYTCVLWDADVRYHNGQWKYYTFDGKKTWRELSPTTETSRDKIQYMLNAYRVLLTRARMGIVICIPKGNPNKTPSGFWEDITRLPQYYDSTYQYLKSLGIQEI